LEAEIKLPSKNRFFNNSLLKSISKAVVVELVDTLDSKSSGSNTVRVQVSPTAPFKNKNSGF
jgi:hypothetical protein